MHAWKDLASQPHHLLHGASINFHYLRFVLSTFYLLLPQILHISKCTVTARDVNLPNSPQRRVFRRETSGSGTA